MKKTNAMRLLDAAHITYEVKEYAYDESDLSGVTAAHKLGMDVSEVYKTLLARGDKTGILVGIIPVQQTLDLKAFAKATGNKRVELTGQNELLPLTGYIRGGCSPIGMKKQYPTYIDSAAQALERVGVSAGQRGLQIVLKPGDLQHVAKATFADLTTA